MTDPPPIKLVTRTRNRWKAAGRQRPIEDSGAALGYIIWQLALNGAKTLHIEDFRYDTDSQRIGVIGEYLAFLVHLSDRLVADALDREQRSRFISSVGLAAARHLQRNQEDIAGPGDYSDPFIETLNRRSKEYGSCAVVANEAGYQMLRTLGSHIQDIMGSDQTNKWVIDHVMEIDGPKLGGQLKESLFNLLKSG